MFQKAREYLRIAMDTGFFYIMLSNILTTLFNFLSGIILVRIISKGEYGIYTYAYNLMSYFLMFSGLGLTSGTFQLCCENNQNKPKMYAVFRYGFSRGFIVNILMAGAIFVYSQIVDSSISRAQFYLSLLAFVPTAMLCFEFTGAYFRSDYRNKGYAALYILNAVLNCVISIAGAYKFGAVGIILANYLAPITSILFIGLNTDLKQRWRGPALERKLRVDLWKLSLVAMASNAISQLLYLIDISMIGTFIRQEEMIASYRIGVTIPTAMNFIPQAIITYIYPYFVNHIDDIVWTKKRVKKLLAGSCVFFGLIAAVLFCLADFIVPTVFGAQYYDAVPIFRMLSVSFFFQAAFRTIFGNLLCTQRKFTFNLIESIIAGIINIVGDYIFIQQFGVLGVALTTLIVMAFSGIVSGVYYWYSLNKKERNLVRK